MLVNTRTRSNNIVNRPVLFIDEAQEMPACVLSELRLLTSSQFDSRILLSVVLAGDLLAMAAQQERTQLDEKLYFECFPITKKSTNRK